MGVKACSIPYFGGVKDFDDPCFCQFTQPKLFPIVHRTDGLRENFGKRFSSGISVTKINT